MLIIKCGGIKSVEIVEGKKGINNMNKKRMEEKPRKCRSKQEETEKVMKKIGGKKRMVDVRDE